MAKERYKLFAVNLGKDADVTYVGSDGAIGNSETVYVIAKDDIEAIGRVMVYYEEAGVEEYSKVGVSRVSLHEISLPLPEVLSPRGLELKLVKRRVERRK